MGVEDDEGDEVQRRRVGEAQTSSSPVAMQLHSPGMRTPCMQAGTGNATVEDVDAMHRAEQPRRGTICEFYPQVRVADREVKHVDGRGHRVRGRPETRGDGHGSACGGWRQVGHDAMHAGRFSRDRRHSGGGANAPGECGAVSRGRGSTRFCLSTGRPDLQYSAKEASRRMARPRIGDRRRVQRVAKYLSDNVQKMIAQMVGGGRATRKSTFSLTQIGRVARRAQRALQEGLCVYSATS